MTEEKLLRLSTLSIDQSELRLKFCNFVSHSKQHDDRISFKFR